MNNEDQSHLDAASDALNFSRELERPDVGSPTLSTDLDGVREADQMYNESLLSDDGGK